MGVAFFFWRGESENSEGVQTITGEVKAMIGRANHGRWFFVLGCAIAASCALPEYKTDSNLGESSSSASGTSSSSSSGGTSSGGGQGGDGTAGGGGAGGGEPGTFMVNCPVEMAKRAPNGPCDKFKADLGSGTASCTFVKPGGADKCCVLQVECLPSLMDPSVRTWHPIANTEDCAVISPNCPYVCGQGLDCAKFMVGLPLPADCACVNIDPLTGDGLKDCLVGAGTCLIEPQNNKFHRLSCEGPGDAFGPLLTAKQGCCTANGQCGGGAAGTCTPADGNVTMPGECVIGP